MPIHTPRLLLRNFIPDDYERLRELDSHPAVLRYRSRRHISPEMTRDFLDRAQRSLSDEPRMFYAYAILRRGTDAWLGQCGLTATVSDPVSAFAWYSLLPDYWGQGYMTEAVRVLLYAGATQFGFNRLFAECHPDNRASVRVMQKVGLQYEGKVAITDPTGKTVERIRYGLTGRELEQLTGGNVRIEPPV